MGILPCLHSTAFAFHRSIYGRSPQLFLKMTKRMASSTQGSVDGTPNPPFNTSFGRPRLIRAVEVFGVQLSKRVKQIKKNLPTKILFFLVGVYCATAFSTVIGQTGDWDILSAALAVFVVEGIGALMYNSSLRLFENIRPLITMFNYWKAGLTLGLFFDSFKY